MSVWTARDHRAPDSGENGENRWDLGSVRATRAFLKVKLDSLHAVLRAGLLTRRERALTKSKIIPLYYLSTTLALSRTTRSLAHSPAPHTHA